MDAHAHVHMHTQLAHVHQVNPNSLTELLSNADLLKLQFEWFKANIEVDGLSYTWRCGGR